MGAPSGKTGVPITVAAGSSPTALIQGVDSYFNVVTSLGDVVTLHSSDSGAPAPGELTLVSGSGTKPVTFFTPGNQALTAVDGAKNGLSSLMTVLAGTQSTLLIVNHTSPVLSTVVLGQSGIDVLIFRLKVQSGTNPVDLTSLRFDAKDSEGVTIPVNSAFKSFTLESGSQSYSMDVNGVSSDMVNMGPFPLGTFTAAPPASLSVTLKAEISLSASAKTVRLSLKDENYFSAQDDTAAGNPSVGITSSGDVTGFPMYSNLMVISEGDTSKTFGNYPNPFRAGLEPTTLEFYLPAASTVSLTLFDTLGNRVAVLLSGRVLGQGLQKFIWDGKNSSGSLVLNGVYYALLEVNGRKFLVKVAVIK